MSSLTDFNQYFKPLLEQSLPKGDTLLAQGMRHILRAPSQLFRPQLVYAVNQCFHGEKQRANGGALAVEYIHSFSLVHDDLPDMDNATMRRSEPCVHTIYGNGQGILIGDALLCEAYSHITHDQNPPQTQIKMLQALMKAAGYEGMTQGQSLDIQPPKDQAAWQSCYELKTGALFGACCVIGALSADIEDTQLLFQLEQLGLKIGLCYQLQDDLLDVNLMPSGKDKHLDQHNYTQFLGTKAAQIRLEQEQQQTLNIIRSFPNPEPFLGLIQHIYSRLCLTNVKNSS